MTTDAPRLGYLPALDGLRAVAVTLVVAYHLELGWAAGGFLGVDLFFVISGFLITTLLLRERDQVGRISLRSFWVRRFRRLVPPLVAMTAATLVATRFYGLPEQWSAIRWDAAAALAYVANWRFIGGGQSYFEALLGPSPLRHTWSLAVEEQWYLIWPLVVAGLLTLVARWPRLARLPLTVIAGAAVTSAALMAALYEPGDPTRVYFGTDTRAQQLLVGAGLAWLMSRHWSATPSTSRTRSRAIVVASAGTFLVIALTVSDQAPWLYHGGFFLVSLLAAVIVWAVSSTDREGPLGWLGAAPLVWLGTRSYGVYLWHWPVIVFVGPPMGIDIGRVPLAVLQVAVSLALAELSFRLVERPMRTTAWRPSLVVGGWTAASLATFAVATVVLVAPDGRSLIAVDVVRPSSTTTSTVHAGPSSSEPEPSGATQAAPPPSVAKPAEREPASVLVLGDSTALTLAENRTLDLSPDWEIQAFARLGCSISGGYPLDAGADLAIVQGDECFGWRTDWTEAVVQVDPDITVVMVGAWEVLDHRIDGVDIEFPGTEWFDVVGAAVGDAVGIAADDGTQVALMAVPCMKQARDSVMETLARNDPKRIAAFNDVLRSEANARPNVQFIDLNEQVCPDGNFLERVDGALVRFDGVHFTPEGADFVWSWLVDELSSLRPTL